MRFLLLLFALVLAPVGLLGQSGVARPGVVALIESSGPVTVTRSDGEDLGGRFHTSFYGIGARLQTGVGGRAHLLFSNGLLIKLMPRSVLLIPEFRQDPYNASLADWQREGSRSIVRLELEEGEILLESSQLQAASTVLVSMGQADVVPGQAAVRVTYREGEIHFGVVQGSVEFRRTGEIAARTVGPGRQGRVVGESVDTEVELAPLELSAKEAAFFKTAPDIRTRVFFATPGSPEGPNWGVKPLWVLPDPDDVPVRKPYRVREPAQLDLFRPVPEAAQ